MILKHGMLVDDEDEDELMEIGNEDDGMKDNFILDGLSLDGNRHISNPPSTVQEVSREPHPLVSLSTASATLNDKLLIIQVLLCHLLTTGCQKNGKRGI